MMHLDNENLIKMGHEKMKELGMDFEVTGTLIWYYYICQREVWLMAHNIFPNQDDENIQIGRIIGENSYQRDKKEIDLGNAKVDLLRTERGHIVIGEIKKSSRFIQSATRQLLFYLLQFKQMGIEAQGELLIPEEKKKIQILLDADNQAEIEAAIKDIEKIVAQEIPPASCKIKYCKNCAYGEFCWS